MQGMFSACKAGQIHPAHGGEKPGLHKNFYIITSLQKSFFTFVGVEVIAQSFPKILNKLPF